MFCASFKGRKSRDDKDFTETHAVKPWLKTYGKNFSLPHFWAIGRLTDQSRPAFATSQLGCSQGGKTVNCFSPKIFFEEPTLM